MRDLPTLISRLPARRRVKYRNPDIESDRHLLREDLCRLQQAAAGADKAADQVLHAVLPHRASVSYR